MLARFFWRKVSYVPHITVGRVKPEKLDRVLLETANFQTEFVTRVDNIYIEEIGQDEKSRLVAKIPLGSCHSAS